MTTEIRIVAMTDLQLTSNTNHNNAASSGSSNRNSNHNNNNNNNNNNGDGEPKYLHKKFKKMATSEVSVSPTLAASTLPDKNILVIPGFETASIGEAGELRKSGYACPYCKLSCAKPSVLQKHIRAHTNERPYPCVPCGFAFKTKSNLYKHCRSRAHALKMEGTDTTKVLQVSCHFSEDSDVSLSDSASNGTGTPPPAPPPPPLTISPNFSAITSPNPHGCSINNSRQVKIYKPKFHTALQQAKPNVEQLHEHIERIITDNQTIVEALDPRLHKLLYRQQNLIETTPSLRPIRKRCYSDSLNVSFGYNLQKQSEFDFDSEQEESASMKPLSSPGPLLGTTRLVDIQNLEITTKRPRLESAPSLHSLDDLSKYPRTNVLQMFGGEVRILERSGESKTMRIEPRQNDPNTSCLSGPETASVVVRSGLHSGGTILHKVNSQTLSSERQCANINFTGIAPNIPPFSLAPSLHVKPTSIVHGGRLIPYIPGMPGPQTLSPEPLQGVDTDLQLESVQPLNLAHSPVSVLDICALEQPTNKFLRPTSLPLKPGTFTPKQHHGITPTANTLPLISPETPRPKKSYGQLYLNGHAYTYLGLKCSTRLFYCTLNRPQPMYVNQQLGLSMYSNWKICKESPPEFEIAHYDSRNRSSAYTLAITQHEDILTHSSQRPNTPSSPDSGLESDGQERNKKIRIFDGGFESNEDYTYVRGRGRGRYVCEECGIRCKKPSMLKKHIRTHTDVRPYTCSHCAFSFKTKGNLTKHMKSKAHYKKCIELKVLPVPTAVCDENIDKEALGRLVIAGAIVEDSSSEEEESEAEADSDESGSEEHEAAQSLLSLGRRLPGLLSIARPTTYPYASNDFLREPISATSPLPSNSIPVTSEKRLSVIHSCRREELSAPIDLTIRQSEFQQPIPSAVSGTALLQTLVHSMERLPMQDRDWPIEPAEGQMLQAYLTERHLMDSKLKQQYRVAAIEPILEPEVVSLACIAERTSIVAELPNRGASSRPQSPQDRKKEEVNSTKSIAAMQQIHQLQSQQTMARKVVVGEPGFHATKSSSEFLQPTAASIGTYVSMTENSRSVCGICNKVFNKPSQLRLHINIHYFERPYRCESCGTSFRTKGHLTKHERSTLHHNKVSMTSTFGAATASNPRPFKCTDCKSAFRIHGHLAKHLRSKMHIMKLECLRKLPFGTYAEMERSGINLNDIDTTDCDSSLTSLQIMAQKLSEKDTSKLGQWEVEMGPNTLSSGDTSSEEGEGNSSLTISQNIEIDTTENCLITMCDNSSDISLIDVGADEIRNGTTSNCQFCRSSFKSLNELRLHCFIEHNLESSKTTVIHASSSFEGTFKKKEDIHRCKGISKCTKRELEAGKRVNVT